MIQSSGADPKLAAELIALNVEVMLAAGLMGGVLLEKLGAMSPANISWCGRRSEATGSSQPISRTTASKSPIRNVRVPRLRAAKAIE